MMDVLTQPYFGIFFSIGVYLIGMFLFKRSNGKFFFQPLFVAMVLGIFLLILFSHLIHADIQNVYTKMYKPGGDIIFWFVNPATIAFAIPLYKRNDILKKYWVEIIVSLIIATVVSTILIYLTATALGLEKSAVLAMLPQGATTAIALPISAAIGGDPAITAMTAITNGVIILAIGKYLIKLFRMERGPIALGLGLGASGHTLGSVKALEVGEIEGSTSSIAIIVIGLVVDLVVPIMANILM